MKTRTTHFANVFNIEFLTRGGSKNGKTPQSAPVISRYTSLFAKKGLTRRTRTQHPSAPNAKQRVLYRPRARKVAILKSWRRIILYTAPAALIYNASRDKHMRRDEKVGRGSRWTRRFYGLPCLGNAESYACYGEICRQQRRLSFYAFTHFSGKKGSASKTMPKKFQNDGKFHESTVLCDNAWKRSLFLKKKKNL